MSSRGRVEDTSRFEVGSIPQVEQIRETGENDLLYEALRRIVDDRNKLARTLNDALGNAEFATRPGEGYVPLGLESFTTADNVFSLPPLEEDIDTFDPDRLELIAVLNRHIATRTIPFRKVRVPVDPPEREPPEPEDPPAPGPGPEAPPGPEDSILSAVYVTNMTTREPYFDGFEVECWNADRDAIIGVRVARAKLDPNTEIWTQDGIALFESLRLGVTYSFRARVRAVGGETSEWSAWANETVGDSTAPNPTYTVTSEITRTGIKVEWTPSALDADFSHYEVFWRVNISTAPREATLPTITPIFREEANFLLPMTTADTGYAWVRAVDVSGNRQPWQALHSGGGFVTAVPLVTSPGISQSIEIVGGYLAAILTCTYTAPASSRFAGVELWMLNHFNKGELVSLGRFGATAGPGAKTFDVRVKVDYAPGSSFAVTTAHNVTFYFVSYSFEDLVNPVTAAPSVVLNPGVTGGVSSPTSPSTVTIERVGTTNILRWARATDVTVVAYNIYRQRNGTRSVPSSPSFASSNLIASRTEAFAASNSLAEHTYPDRLFDIIDLDPFDPARYTYWVEAVNWLGMKGSATQSATVEVLTNGSGEAAPEWPQKFEQYNRLKNAQLFSGATTADLEFATWLTGTWAQGLPVTVTSTAHGFATGDMVTVFCTGGPASPAPVPTGDWFVTVVDANNFTLDGSKFAGVGFGYNCKIVYANNQPMLETAGKEKFMSWVGVDTATAGAPIPLFESDGTYLTHEVRLRPTASAASTLQQLVRISKFTNGAHLTLSIYAKKASGSGNPGSLAMRITLTNRILGGVSLHFYHAFSSTLLTTAYQRFTCTLALPSLSSFLPDGFLLFSVDSEAVPSGTILDTYVDRPMINYGDMASPWTPFLAPDDEPGNLVNRATPVLPPWGRTTTTVGFRDATAPYTP